MSGFPDVAQYPLNVVGPKGQNAFLGLTRIFTGTGGLPILTGTAPNQRTTLGIPGVTATLTATGVYSLTYPSPTVDVTILPHVSVPTGYLTSADINTVTPYAGVSGVAKIVVSGVLAGVGTGIGSPLNLPTGASLDLLFFVAPVTAY